MANNGKTYTNEQLRLQKQYGSWAVVTDASSGIGRALAIKVAEAGLNVVLVARRQDVLEELATELTSKYGVEIQVMAADLGQETAIDQVLANTQAIDVGLFIAAAGFGTSGPFLMTSPEQELDMLNVNCRALMLMSLEFGQRFAQCGRGGMILLSSIVGFQGMPNAAHYAATKAYVQNFAEALQQELAPSGVDVLAAAPGPTNSGFAERAGMKMGAALSPAEIAEPILGALGRKTTVLPGFLSKLLVYSLSTLPRWARIRIMGQVMHGMTKHRQPQSVASTA